MIKRQCQLILDDEVVNRLKKIVNVSHSVRLFLADLDEALNPNMHDDEKYLVNRITAMQDVLKLYKEKAHGQS